MPQTESIQQIYEKEDLDPYQQIDWKDINQKYCWKHKRNYHYICRGCKPI